MSADLGGKTIMITGASSGIGKHAAFELARMGADLVLVCRNPDKAEQVRHQIRERGGDPGKVDLIIADLASMAQVRRAAGEFLAMDRPLHVLLNNAGLLVYRRTETEDGFESTIAVNHLAPFLLTNLLLERIVASAPARIVTVASRAHMRSAGRIRLGDLHSRHDYSPWRVYGQSKLANILFTRELARRLAGTGVTANCLHPGVVGTGFLTNNGPWARMIMALGKPFLRSETDGARTSIYLCASPEVEGISGEYFAECAIARTSSHARNDDDARELWNLSANMTGEPGLAGS